MDGWVGGGQGRGVVIRRSHQEDTGMLAPPTSMKSGTSRVNAETIWGKGS